MATRPPKMARLLALVGALKAVTEAFSVDLPAVARGTAFSRPAVPPRAQLGHRPIAAALRRVGQPPTIMRATAGRSEKEDGGGGGDGEQGKISSSSSTIPQATAPLAVVCAVLAHGGAWADFLSRLADMRANSSGAEFASSLRFWLFSAVIHPVLQPILYASEVLHAAPGPKVADIVPVSFLLGCGAIAVAYSSFSDLRRVTGIALMSLFVLYIGAGLEGRDPSLAGDYDIQLDGTYGEKIERGCPAPEEVQLASVEGFDLQKYAGHWYWHKVHDWTQFKEIYDTTLDIELTDEGYKNTLGIKGPSPKTNPLSWDKSPLANGAHYSWSGTIGPNAQPGVSNERGFGVAFPNYIVDVKTDSDGQYDEIIQFQCIETGGIRLYEGIDFMSRSPVMAEDDLLAMHERAKRAGLYPYGASPEQMHHVERRDSSLGPVHNAWQRMWDALGVRNAMDVLDESK